MKDSIFQDVQEGRRKLMARVRAKHTKPELIVRKLAHRLGYRFRLHVKYLQGSPDLVFPKRRSIIFVHGCFWHRHDACSGTTTPKTREDYWLAKFAANQSRDRRNILQLTELGWRTLVVWECETRDPSQLSSTLTAFLDG